jgi:type II secretory pathway predicted ATPase ExeA
MEATRNPLRRFARISGPIDGADLFGRLAVELGARGAPSDSRAVAWRALAEAARLCRWQGLHLLLVVDDCQGLTTSSDLMDLQRLDELDPDPSTRLTVLRLSRPSELADSDWSLSVRLDPLTRSETATYVTTKLEAAGRSDPTFTPRAIARLQAASAGIPRGIDRLASLALIASACRGLEMVSPDVIDEAAAECPSLVPATVDFPSN